MWARIENHIAVELTDLNPEGRYHPSLLWVPCPHTVRPGDVYDGSTFAGPKPEVTLAPATCTPAQGLVALFSLKRITEDNILEAIASIPDDELRYTAKIGYQRATSWERASPAMLTMAKLLLLSEQDMDELFNFAASVQV